MNNTRLEGLYQRNIGTVHFYKCDLIKALNYYNDALRIIRKTNDKNNEALILWSIGGLHTDFGEYSKSLAYYQQALNIAENIIKLIIIHEISFKEALNSKAI